MQIMKHKGNDDLINQYWETITKGSLIYGADVNGTLFDEKCLINVLKGTSSDGF